MYFYEQKFEILKLFSCQYFCISVGFQSGATVNSNYESFFPNNEPLIY